MLRGWLGQLKVFLKKCFPERQLVLRTKGRVSYAQLSSGAQMSVAALALVLVGWAAFATVGYALRSELMAAKDAQAVNTQLTHQGLLDEVAAYQKKLESATSGLEANHSLMLGLVEQNTSLQQSLRFAESQLKETQKDRKRVIGLKEQLKENLSGSKEKLRSLTSENFDLQESLGTTKFNLKVAQIERDKAQREGKRLNRLASNLEVRLTDLEEMEQDGVRQFVERTDVFIESMEKVVEMAGMDVAELLAAGTGGGRGGPFVEIKPDDLPAANLKAGLTTLEVRFAHAKTLRSLMGKLPLAAPMDTYYVTSSYGKRQDPINKHWAVHRGLDLGGPYKSAIYSPAPGVVKFAGKKNGYGNLVEIDHGAGIVTRYAHMAKFFVKKGQKINFRDKIGLVGNTGRSTGAHLHYEVSFHGKTRNPMKFIKAGRHVFKK